MKRLSLALIALGVLAMSGLAQPVTDAGTLLRKTLDAAAHLRYTGIRTVTLRAGVDRQVHTELIEKQGDKTRVEFPKDSPYHGQVIVESDQERRHFFPAKNEIRVLPPRREKGFARLERMASGPGARRRLHVSDGGMLAGLHTELVTLTDPMGNPLQKLWIEPRSGVLLKRELYDRTGVLQGGFEFTQINLNPRIDGRDFRLAIKGVKVLSLRDDLRALALRLKLPEISLASDAPYQLDAVRMQDLGGQQVLVQQYSNDERRFSFFLLRGAIDPSRLQKQAGNLRSLIWQKDGVSCVLLGDLDDTEMQDVSRRLGR